MPLVTLSDGSTLPIAEVIGGEPVRVGDYVRIIKPDGEASELTVEYIGNEFETHRPFWRELGDE